MQSGVAVPAWGLLCVVFIGLVILASIGGVLALVMGSGRERHGTLRALGLALALGIGLPVLAFALLAGFWVSAHSPLPHPPVQIQAYSRPNVETRDFVQGESDPWRVVTPEAISGSSATVDGGGVVGQIIAQPPQATAEDGPVSALKAIQALAPPEPATFTDLTQEQHPEKQVAVASARPTTLFTTTIAPPAQAAPVPTDDRTVRSVETLPTWAVLLSDQRVIPGEPFRQVVASQLFATEAEARQDARRQVSEQILLDLRNGGWLRSQLPTRFQPQQQTVDAVIKQTHVEVVQQDFGSFFAPMYRVWQQVEIGPHARSMLLMEIRSDQAAIRNQTVLVAVGLIFCLPLAIVMRGWLGRRVSWSGRWLVLGATILAILILMRWSQVVRHEATATESPPMSRVESSPH